jgi:hypothetical protein
MTLGCNPAVRYISGYRTCLNIQVYDTLWERGKTAIEIHQLLAGLARGTSWNAREGCLAASSGRIGLEANAV